MLQALVEGFIGGYKALKADLQETLGTNQWVKEGDIWRLNLPIGRSWNIPHRLSVRYFPENPATITPLTNEQLVYIKKENPNWYGPANQTLVDCVLEIEQKSQPHGYGTERTLMFHQGNFVYGTDTTLYPVKTSTSNHGAVRGALMPLHSTDRDYRAFLVAVFTQIFL